ncbi:sugar transferase [Campylobacter jejuni subsp. doylei]|nr:sugar transferase [Campylobacter jejuni subsp. doylei]SUW97552.1 sugar transferase [Campylobacter jejuni subsp. doylei]
MGGGYLTLFKKLYKIKKQHQKEKQIYQETIKVFPQLKYPNLETCPDYSESLRYKFHLSYMLGEVLIKADKTWHKGGGFKLKNNIKKVNKEFQIFREIFKEFDQINSSVLKGLIDNKQLFLKEFPRIKNILKIHQDYKAILDNIFHNFNYFIQNFDLIEEWLLSDDFKERYKKENHPYPSLLDPKKLNDKNEEINYNNIPAELAWEMNLPLPENYDFVFVWHGNIGSIAMNLFCLLSDIKMCLLDTKDNYIFTMSNLLQNIPFIPTLNNNVFGVDCYGEKYEKIFYLFQKQYNILYIARDPISIIKSRLNHPNGILFNNITEDMKNITYFNSDFKDLFPKMYYGWCGMEKPKIQEIESYLWNYSLDLSYFILKKYIKKIIFLNFSYMYSKYSFDIFVDLCNLFNYTPPLKKYKLLFEKRILKDRGLLHLPVKININNYTIFIYSYYDYILDIKNVSGYTDIKNDIFKGDKLSILEDILVLADKNTKYKIFKNDEKSIKFRNYIIKYIRALDLYVYNINKNLITEEQILEYMKNNVKLLQKIKIMINENQNLIKTYNPEYLNTWTYYQEFEKMCKELDDDIQEKDL